VNNWPKTIGFGAVQVSAAALIYFWCQEVHFRFRVEHPGGQGAVLPNFFWAFSWVGIAVALALTAILVFSHVRKLGTLYETTYYFGIWLLVVWIGAALLAMEIAFVPTINLRGAHF
jgi:hypothetical protein